MDQGVKNFPANEGDMGLIPRSGRSPGKGNGKPFQYPSVLLIICIVFKIIEIDVDRAILDFLKSVWYTYNFNLFKYPLSLCYPL